MIEKLNEKYNIILASGSPRRKELMEKAGYQFEVITADVDESFKEGTKPKDVVSMLAEKKANAVLYKTKIDKILIIAADTIVVSESKILGKPTDLEDAIKMLESLSNNTHQVITGVCFIKDNKTTIFSSITEVALNKMSLTEIKYYCNNFEVLDKAGAYGVQDWVGLNKVKTIKGCYYNVMGLPVSLLYKKLEEILDTNNSTLT